MEVLLSGIAKQTFLSAVSFMSNGESSMHIHKKLQAKKSGYPLIFPTASQHYDVIQNWLTFRPIFYISCKKGPTTIHFGTKCK